MLSALLGAIFIGLSLGVFGSGGSILTVPVLLYLVHMPADIAIATSLLIVAAISFSSSLLHIRQRLISWPHVVLFGLPGMFGTYLGAWAGTLIDARWQLLLFVMLMLIAAFFMWRNETPQAQQAQKINVKRVVADGLVVGAITGFVGVGGGFLIVPALVLLGGLSMSLAIGTSLFIIALKSFVGFAKYYEFIRTTDYVFDWSIVGLIILCGILGSFLGVWLGQKLPKAKLQKGFAVFLMLMAGFVFIRSVL